MQRFHITARVLLAAFCGLAALVLPRPSLAETPEYLSAESPIPRNIRESQSATDRIGSVADFSSLSQPLMPGVIFPQLRDQVPKSGLTFLDEATFRLSPRSYYRKVDLTTDSIAEAFAFGGAFGIETGRINEFLKIGVTGYTSQKLYGPEDRQGTGLLAPVQESYWALGEAYVDVKVADMNAVLYRQLLSLPYINANDSRMVPNTFEAYGVHSTAIPDLRFAAGHIQRIRFRNSSEYDHLSSFAGAPGTKRGVSVLAARYNFNENWFVGAVEEYGWDTFNVFYAESEHYFPLGDDMGIRLGTQFTDQRSVGDELLGSFDAQHAGAKFEFGIESLILSSSFTWASQGSAIFNPWGGSPSYNSVMISNFDRSGEKSVRLGMSYDFTDLGIEGLAASASWLHGNTPDSGTAASPDQQEVNFNIDYRPTVIGLDNLWFRFRYAINDRDDSLGGIDRDDFRVILNYSFSF